VKLFLELPSKFGAGCLEHHYIIASAPQLAVDETNVQYFRADALRQIAQLVGLPVDGDTLGFFFSHYAVYVELNEAYDKQAW